MNKDVDGRHENVTQPHALQVNVMFADVITGCQDGRPFDADEFLNNVLHRSDSQTR